MINARVAPKDEFLKKMSQNVRRIVREARLRKYEFDGATAFDFSILFLYLRSNLPQILVSG